MAGSPKVLILGGGINGAAIARELTLNGVSVCLVDSGDIAGGATAYSSRLIHGGLRYLEFAEIGLVREALAERERLLRLAPQFVRPLRLFIPVSSRWGGLRAGMARFFRLSRSSSAPPPRRGLNVVKLGLWMYDWLAAGSSLPRRGVCRVGAKETPPVDADQFRWLCSYSDAQISFPERFVVALLDDARQVCREKGLEFAVYPYHQASLRDEGVEIRATAGEFDGGAVASAAPIAVYRPDVVINATGAWVDHTLARLAIPSPRLIGGAKGSHLLTSHPQLAAALGGSGVYAEARDGRPVFLLPLDEFTLVGTTDLPFDERPEKAVASDEEVDYLLSAARDVFPTVGLTRADIDWTYCGVRPLPFVDRASPAAVTRRHWLKEHPAGGNDPAMAVPCYSVIGGKLTTCRSLAEQTASTVLKRLGRTVVANTQQRPLPGGGDYPQSPQALEQAQQRLARDSGFAVEQIRAVWCLCGNQAFDMLSGDDDRDGLASLAGAPLPLRFVRRVIRREWVTRLADLVERRLMLLYHRQLRATTLRRLGEMLVEENKLSPARLDAEIAACRERLRSHFGREIDEA